mmetsp:Transcript_9062/g.20757  ORF Transcript_9062/g.20757 Transcript_9062/m.20757 type:complete len:246 (-) Transcript_9062:1653-2390(-)
MQKDWRQYAPEPDPNVLINCNVLATGCWNHANVYWIYAVDSRQFSTILFNEPRFLSITPDLGLIDLGAEETSPLVRFIADREIAKQNKTDFSHVAFPIVTGAWYNPDSHVPSPVVYTKEDGTKVTNFAESLALWVGIDIDKGTKKRAANATGECSAANTLDESEFFPFLDPGQNSELFFDAVRNTVRRAEDRRRSYEEARADGPGMVDCTKKARFGVSKTTARINYPFSPFEIEAMVTVFESSQQ